MSNPQITSFFDEDTFTVSYVVKDPASDACAIIDSVLDYNPSVGRTGTASADKITHFVKDNGLTVEWILETHVHADHLSAAPYIQEKLGGKIAIGANITEVQGIFGKMFNEGTEFERDGSQFDKLLNDGDLLPVGEMTIQVLHTPGHTPACLTFVVGDTAFVGDTLFMHDYGTARADFPGGDAATLYRSIQKIYALPDTTRLFMCHDYKAPGRDEFLWESTVAQEKAKNVHIHEGVTEDEFVAMRNGRDANLSPPRLILPSIQVNMRAGHMPEPEDNGTRYLKVPINVIGG